MKIINKNLKGVIFDLDGTLIDSTKVWEHIDDVFLGKRGFVSSPEYVSNLRPLGYEAAAEYTIKKFGLNETKEEIVKEWFSMAIDEYTYNIKLKKGAREYLNYLKQNGIKMAIATASDLRMVEPVLKNNNVYEMFDNITTVNEVSRGKGFPDIYNLAAAKMGLKYDECVVFEDIAEGIKGAKDGNFITVGVYDESWKVDTENLKKICDLFIYDFYELL